MIGNYDTGWITLGERPIPGTGGGLGIVINEFNTGSDWVELYNYGADVDMSGWTWYWHDQRNYEGTYLIPKGFTLKSKKFVVIDESSGTNTATTLYMGSNMMWTPTSSGGIAGEIRNEKGDGVDFFKCTVIVQTRLHQQNGAHLMSHIL